MEGARRGATLRDYPQENFVVIKEEKICAFVKFELILPLLLCLLDLLMEIHCRSWGSKINLWVYSRTKSTESQKYRILLTTRKRPNNYLELLEENILGNMILSH